MNELIAAAIGGLLGFVVGFFADRIRMGAAYRSGEEIVSQARSEAEALRKDQELTGKEELLKRREKLEQENDETREELRDQERRLEKRESILDEMQDDFRKKERMLESTQNKLADRTKALDSREKEVERILREEQDQLYKISSLDQASATEMLLNRLENSLRNEMGALILKHEGEV